MTMWKVFVLCNAFLTGNINAAITTGNIKAVVGGRHANIKDFPYQASLRYLNEHLCGAAIISERHILTAGHCIYDYISPPYKRLTVVTATSYILGTGNPHKIAKINVHPNFSISDDHRDLNDIALITLKREIVFNEYQQNINLPEHDFKVGDKANLTGWGLAQHVSEILTNELQLLETQLMSIDECQKRVIDPEDTKIYDTEICTDNSRGTGMCIGDSGGPLAANGELIGIVSWTDGDYCGDGHPDVYTNVYQFKDFIESVMNGTIL